MSGTVYGYIMLHTDWKAADDRVDLLRGFGVEDCNIIIEKPGKKSGGSRLQKLIGKLRAGDILAVGSIGDLGSGSTEIGQNLARIADKHDVSLAVLDMPLMAGRSASEPLLPLISQIVVQTLVYMSQQQKETRTAQQRKGIDSAMARGVQFGRPKEELPPDFFEVVRLWHDGGITGKEAAERLNISLSTFRRRVNDYGLKLEDTFPEQRQAI